MIDSIFTIKDYPKIFEKKIYPYIRIEEILKNPEEKNLKDTDELFTTYESQYPYSKDTSYEALIKISSKNGRMRLYEGFFLWFSEYYDLYDKAKNVLMSKEDYMPLTWKYYIAIMAVSTIRCEYLLRELEMQFLLKGGDEIWLIKGLEAVPDKLRQLEKINNILAHQPWKLKLQDIKEIHSKFNTKGWHMNELIHAALIMTFYHRLAAVVESMRLNVSDNLNCDDESKTNYDDSKETKLPKVEENVKKIIISELELINKTEENGQQVISHKRKPSSEETLKLNTSFDSFINLNCREFSKHISSYCTIYLDFDSHSEEYESEIVKRKLKN
jgi:hypothetical protein